MEGVGKVHIENFNYFYLVAKFKSISRVAKSQHISQSALSQQLQKFEASIGVSLLERSNKGVTMTRMGEVVMKYSENIIKTYEKMLQEINAVREDLSIVKIEASHAIADYSLPCTLYKIKEQYSYHRYELIGGSSPSIVDDVLNNICDVGFVYEDPNLDDLVSEKLGVNTMVLISNYQDPMPSRISIADLFQYPLITLNDKYEIKRILKKNFQPLGYPYENLRILFETDSIEALKSSVARGHGLSFVPYIAVKEELYRKKFKIIEIEGINIAQTVYLISKKGNRQNSSVDEFIDAFRKMGSNSFC